MHFSIDTAESHFTTPKAVSSRTRSRYYKGLTGYACSRVELPAILSSILSGILILLPVLYFPAPIPKSFKWFDAPLTAALALTTSLRLILNAARHHRHHPSLSMTSNGRNNVT
jgi:hypothetical protein